MADIYSAMLFYDRSDGDRVRNLRAYNAILPYVLRKRNEAAVLFSKDIEVENVMAYVRRKNAEADSGIGPASGSGGGHYSLFGLLISAALRTIALKPRLNRFVHRRAVYQRRGISVSFIVKKTLSESAPEGNAKIRFEPEDDIAAAADKINAGIATARSGAPGPDDREFEIAHRLPFGKAAITLLFRILDRFNIAPARMIEADPLFTSIYVANLGSIGLDTPYHHLYEWGTASIFMVIGRVFQKETRRPAGGMELRHYLNVKFTVDERIAEGTYFAHAAALFQRLLSKPEALELPPDFSETEA
jgi:hypothetical protein